MSHCWTARPRVLGWNKRTWVLYTPGQCVPRTRRTEYFTLTLPRKVVPILGTYAYAIYPFVEVKRNDRRRRGMTTIVLFNTNPALLTLSPRLCRNVPRVFLKLRGAEAICVVRQKIRKQFLFRRIDKSLVAGVVVERTQASIYVVQRFWWIAFGAGPRASRGHRTDGVRRHGRSGQREQ
jgi:hypothetical protein